MLTLCEHTSKRNDDIADVAIDFASILIPLVFKYAIFPNACKIISQKAYEVKSLGKRGAQSAVLMTLQK
jgi:hypothetical protein